MKFQNTVENGPTGRNGAEVVTCLKKNHADMLHGPESALLPAQI